MLNTLPNKQQWQVQYRFPTLQDMLEFEWIHVFSWVTNLYIKNLVSIYNRFWSWSWGCECPCSSWSSSPLLRRYEHRLVRGGWVGQCWGHNLIKSTFWFEINHSITQTGFVNQWITKNIVFSTWWCLIVLWLCTVRSKNITMLWPVPGQQGPGGGLGPNFGAGSVSVRGNVHKYRGRRNDSDWPETRGQINKEKKIAWVELAVGTIVTHVWEILSSYIKEEL